MEKASNLNKHWFLFLLLLFYPCFQKRGPILLQAFGFSLNWVYIPFLVPRLVEHGHWGRWRRKQSGGICEYRCKIWFMCKKNIRLATSEVWRTVVPVILAHQHHLTSATRLRAAGGEGRWLQSRGRLRKAAMPAAACPGCSAACSAAHPRVRPSPEPRGAGSAAWRAGS